MHGFYSWVDKVRRFHKFSNEELLWLGLSILIMSVILGFDDGRETFALVPWLGNFLLGMVAIAIAVFARESVRRIVGLEQGFRIEFKPFLYGLLGGLILVLMTTGLPFGPIVFLAYSSMRMHTLQAHRLGYFRYQLGYFTQAKIAFFGIAANLVLAIIFKTFVFLPDVVVDKLVFVNVLFAITNALPIPPLDGAHLMYGSRIVYAFVLGATVALGLLLLVPGIHYVIILVGTIMAAILFWLLLLHFEKPK